MTPRLILAVDELTSDAFLGGRVHLTQPRSGYRAGVDPVLLAASVPAKSGQSVLDLGCGVGTAMLCLAARVPGLDLTGVELMPAYAELARQNGGHAAQVVTADLLGLPNDLRNRQFDHVITNPPYFDRAHGDPAHDAGRNIGRGGDTPLADWLDVAIKRTAPKGYLSIIQHISRLPEVLTTVQGRMGSIIIKPIAPRLDTPANLFLLQARQAGRAPFHLMAPLVLHQGDRHTGDFESYTPQVRSILRDAAKLDIAD